MKHSRLRHAATRFTIFKFSSNFRKLTAILLRCDESLDFILIMTSTEMKDSRIAAYEYKWITHPMTRQPPRWAHSCATNFKDTWKHTVHKFKTKGVIRFTMKMSWSGLQKISWESQFISCWRSFWFFQCWRTASTFPFCGPVDWISVIQSPPHDEFSQTWNEHARPSARPPDARILFFKNYFHIICKAIIWKQTSVLE